MVARAYLDTGRVNEKVLGTVALTQRAYAQRNPRAMMRAPITMEDYLASPWVAEPLRRLDCCLESDAAVALVVTSTARAAALRQPAVLVSGFATGGGMTLYNAGRTTLIPSAARDLAPRLYASAGIGPAEVDVAELYDAFTFLVPLQLEDYGLVPAGEVGPFILDGGTGPGGRLPVNTHGGHLSEGYVHGLNHVAEAVTQLRGRAETGRFPAQPWPWSAASPATSAGPPRRSSSGAPHDGGHAG